MTDIVMSSLFFRHTHPRLHSFFLASHAPLLHLDRALHLVAGRVVGSVVHRPTTKPRVYSTEKNKKNPKNDPAAPPLQFSPMAVVKREGLKIRHISSHHKKYSPTGFLAGMPLVPCGAASKTRYRRPGVARFQSTPGPPPEPSPPTGSRRPWSPLARATHPPLLPSSPSSRMAATLPQR